MSLEAQLATSASEWTASRLEVVELRAKVGKNSGNSSKPPSTDMPGMSTVQEKAWQAAQAWLTGLLRGALNQSVRQTSAVMTELFHVPMSNGMVAKTQDQISGALERRFGRALPHA